MSTSQSPAKPGRLGWRVTTTTECTNASHSGSWPWLNVSLSFAGRVIKPIVRRIVSSLGFEHSRFFFRGAELLVNLVQDTVEALVMLTAVRTVFCRPFPLATAIHFARSPMGKLMSDKLSLQIRPAFVAPVPHGDLDLAWVIPSAPPWTLELF